MSKTKIKKFIRPAVFIAVGVIVGLVYALFIDGNSRPVVSAAVGAVAGIVLFGLSKSGGCRSCECSNSTCGLWNGR